MRRYAIHRDPDLLCDVLYDRKKDFRFVLPAYENPGRYIVPSLYHLKMMTILWLYRLGHPSHV